MASPVPPLTGARSSLRRFLDRRRASRRRQPGPAALALLCLCIAGGASAHQSSVAYSALVVEGRELRYTLQISSSDLYEAVGVEKDRPVTRDEVKPREARLLSYLLERIHVQSGGASCGGSPVGVEYIDKTDSFFAVARLRFECPRSIERATVRYDLFFDLDPRHEGLARISFGDDSDVRQQVFRADSRELAIDRELGALDHARDYLLLGIEHIFTGYDHIAFVFGLLIIAGAGGLRRGAGEILGVVSAFTLAHSVTLIASALGWVSLSPRYVEPAIALSIIYVGVENLVQPRPRRRFALTFGFGLVHGFGFASVLREIGLPSKGLLLSLVSFNVGVEIGQLAVVAAVLPLLALIAATDERARRLDAVPVAGVAVITFVLFRRFDVPAPQLGAITFAGAPLVYALGRRFGYDRVVRIGGSTVIAVLAAFWFAERVTGTNLLGGALG